MFIDYHKKVPETVVDRNSSSGNSPEQWCSYTFNVIKGVIALEEQMEESGLITGETATTPISSLSTITFTHNGHYWLFFYIGPFPVTLLLRNYERFYFKADD